MIFTAKNEKNEESWRLVLEDRKTVTRRLKPVQVGKIIAVQPGRGKKQVCKIQVIRCHLHKGFMIGLCELGENAVERYKEALDHEAHREGFYTWQGLMNYFKEKHIDIDKLWRIEFKKI